MSKPSHAAPAGASHQAGAGAPAALTWFEGAWHSGDVPTMSARSPGAWLGASVFDGARAFAGVAPDLDRHCERVIRSARLLGMEPPITAAEIERLAWEGIAKFSPDVELYVRPFMWASVGFVIPEPTSTHFALTLEPMPLPPPTGFSACLSPYRRPATDMAPTDAKAGCLYPNVARAQADAERRGFEAAVVLDPAGNVAEFASANLFIAKDGVVATPAINGTFLNGITRQRVLALLREAGYAVEERRVTFADVLAADEVFATGNYAKVKPCIRVDDRHYQPGPVAARARDLYFAWAKAKGGAAAK
ncbi:MAG: branched-chain amino acid aminotransferase [Rhodospirillaceae bacterium]|nr:branched-chain amino acid aminotransferase [Rhodospirillaceae bacterium]